MNKTLSKLTGAKPRRSGPKRNWRRVLRADQAMLNVITRELERAKLETDVQFPEGTPETQFYTLAGAFMDALVETGSVSKAFSQLYPRTSKRRASHPRECGNELLELIKTYFPSVGAYMREWCYRVGVTPPYLVNQLRELAVNGAQDNVRLQATKALLQLMDLDKPDKALPVIMAQLAPPQVPAPAVDEPPVEAAEQEPLEAAMPPEQQWQGHPIADVEDPFEAEGQDEPLARIGGAA